MSYSRKSTDHHRLRAPWGISSALISPLENASALLVFISIQKTGKYRANPVNI